MQYEMSPEKEPLSISSSALLKLGQICEEDSLSSLHDGPSNPLREAVVIDPSLGDYCEWRRQALKKRSKQGEVQGEKALAIALNFHGH